MVRNRDHWTITDINADGTVAAQGPAGRVRLPPHYVTEAVELAYAETAHAAQGRTVDHSLLLVDGPLDNRGVYVPLTRGRIDNHAYVAIPADDPRTPVEVLSEAVRQDWADTPAITVRAGLREPGRQSQPLRAGKLRVLATEQQRLRSLHISDRVDIAARTSVDHAETVQSVQQARIGLEQARSARQRAEQQLERLSSWRLSSWQLRPTFEAAYRNTNRDLRAARRTLDETTERLEATTVKLHKAERWIERHQPDIDREPHVAAQLAADRHARAALAIRQQPEWALRALGQRPMTRKEADTWDHAVGHIEQHRTLTGVTSLDVPLGPEPHSHGNDNASWRTAQRTLNEAASRLGRSHDIEHGHERSHGLGIHL